MFFENKRMRITTYKLNLFLVLIATLACSCGTNSAKRNTIDLSNKVVKIKKLEHKENESLLARNTSKS